MSAIDIYVQIDCVQTRDEEFEPRTTWSLFNCFTEVMKDASLFRLPPRIQALLDKFTGVNIQNN
jgi:hypothetical protein